MPTPKKTTPKKRPSKYEKPVKIDVTFNELIDMAVTGKGYKAPKKSK